jgi:hypothetical protein
MDKFSNKEVLQMRSYFLIFVFTIFCSHQADGKPIKGMVNSNIGKPIKDVFIYSRSLMQIGSETFTPFTVTNENGEFKLENRGKVLFLQHPDFEPLIKILDERVNEVEITLQPLNLKKISFSTCSTVNKSDWTGRKMRFPITKIKGVIKETGEDSNALKVEYSRQSERSFMNMFWGTMATNGLPPEELILASKSYLIRSIKFNKWLGIEFKGELENGRFWRYIGREGESISYSSSSREASKYFDSIIKRMCISD